MRASVGCPLNCSSAGRVTKPSAAMIWVEGLQYKLVTTTRALYTVGAVVPQATHTHLSSFDGQSSVLANVNLGTHHGRLSHRPSSMDLCGVHTRWTSLPQLALGVQCCTVTQLGATLSELAPTTSCQSSIVCTCSVTRKDQVTTRDFVSINLARYSLFLKALHTLTHTKGSVLCVSAHCLGLVLLLLFHVLSFCKAVPC